MCMKAYGQSFSNPHKIVTIYVKIYNNNSSNCFTIVFLNKNSAKITVNNDNKSNVRR